jgi:purine-nucleoside phosphorylase
LPWKEAELLLDESLAAIRRYTDLHPRVGIVLGSGLGGLAEVVETPQVIPYADIPYMPRLTAAGHAGEWILGMIGEVPVVMMRGRAHLYEGHDPLRATYGVRLMRAMGIETLVASNAAGGLNPRFQVGDLVLIDSHLDWLYRSSWENRDERIDQVQAAGSLMRCGGLYDRNLIALAESHALRFGFHLARGTYLATLGPTYETRAEYRAFRKIGADMVGMSTVPEILLAASLGIRTLAFSVITNVAVPDVPVATSHDEVLAAGQAAQSKLMKILRACLPSM